MKDTITDIRGSILSRVFAAIYPYRDKLMKIVLFRINSYISKGEFKEITISKERQI
ncbi:MAG: hypothetical protein QXJ62_05400 [Nitrososphaeria archaeon]